MEPIQSRTMIFKFGDVKQVDILRRMFYILENEKVEYDKKNVANIVKCHGSDIRSMIQTLQKLTVEEEGKRTLRSFMSGKEIFKKVVDLLKDKNLVELRKLVSDNNLDGQEVLKYIFRNMEELSPSKYPEVCYELSEGLYKMSVGTDKEIVMTATMIAIMNIL
jgi:replication factor C small subunit